MASGALLQYGPLFFTNP